VWYKNIAGRFFGLVTKHACDGQRDRRMDGQNYDSQDRASIPASRGKEQATQTSQKEVSQAGRWPTVDVDRRYSICTITLLKFYRIQPNLHKLRLPQHASPL